MKQYDVVALGELLIDFAPYSTNEAGYPILSANPGGAPGNFLAALARYGCKTAMIGKVGDDSFGRALIGTLQEAGIDTRGILADPKVFTTLLLFLWMYPGTGTSVLPGSPVRIPA